jgi:predicted DNA binding protein
VLREFVFKTSGRDNPLCRYTKEDPGRWILIHLYRGDARGPTGRALFIIHGPPIEVERFLAGEFGRRYGTYEVLSQEDETTSVEVSSYAMPSYRGMDPVAMTIRLLGPDAIFEPILVHEGYIHVRVLAVQRRGDAFRELVSRLSSATDPSDFKLIHQGAWDPIRRLTPADDHLSKRQEETLRMAIDMGYYDAPRRCTLTELSQAFGISKAAVHKHLQGAEAKVLKANFR